MSLKPKLHTPTLSADSKSLKFPSKTQAKIGPKSLTCSQIFQNRRSHCIEAISCLRLLRVFKKSADKVGVCKSGLIFNPDYFLLREYLAVANFVLHFQQIGVWNNSIQSLSIYKSIIPQKRKLYLS